MQMTWRLLVGGDVQRDRLASIKLTPKDENIQRARSILRGRQRRAQLLGADIFGDPAWDMLLFLYVSEADSHVSPTTAVTAACGSSATTGLRYLDQLEDAGLIERFRVPGNNRNRFVRLTPRSHLALDAMLHSWRA